MRCFVESVYVLLDGYVGRLNARVMETAGKRRGIESAGKKPPVKLEVS